MILKKCLSLCLLFALGLAVTACGYRGPPHPPEGVEKTYPRTYPMPDAAYPEDDTLF